MSEPAKPSDSLSEKLPFILAVDKAFNALPRKSKSAERVDKVYFVWAEDTPYFKIGFTHEPLQVRLGKLQVGSPLKLHLLAWALGSREDERHMHMALARFRRRGEWFRLSETAFKAVAQSFGHAV